jgi:hypothetical protein
MLDPLYATGWTPTCCEEVVQIALLSPLHGIRQIHMPTLSLYNL